MLVEHEVVIAEMRAADVPVEVLRLHVEGEAVGEDAVERLGDVFLSIGGKIGRCLEPRGGLVHAVHGWVPEWAVACPETGAQAKSSSGRRAW